MVVDYDAGSDLHDWGGCEWDVDSEQGNTEATPNSLSVAQPLPPTHSCSSSRPREARMGPRPFRAGPKWQGAGV